MREDKLILAMPDELSPNLFRSTVIDGAASLLFPARCHVCGIMLDEPANDIACDACWQETYDARLGFDYCEKCDASLPRLQLQPQARRCGLCDDFAFTYARACGSYTKALRESVLQLKIRPYLSPRLTTILQTTLAEFPAKENFSALIPVPLHPTRLRARKFNQAEIIARVLAITANIPINNVSLIRAADTERHRAGMDAKARADSLQGAFFVRAPRLLSEQNILVVDDVMTTGSTAHEIAQTLLASGAQSVSFLTLARAISIHR